MLRYGIRLLVLTIAVGVISGCGGTQEVKTSSTMAPLPHPYLKKRAPLKPRIVFGKSTFEDIHDIFGKPSEVRRTRTGPVWIYHAPVDAGLVDLLPYSIVAPDRPLAVYFFEDGTVARLSRRLPG